MKTKYFYQFLLIVYLWLLIPLISITQNYIPFPEENASWTVFEFDQQIGIWETYIYTYNGDTILNNYDYKKVYQLNDTNAGQDTIWKLHTFMRQEVDSMRIYFVRHYRGETEEKLGYDFSANIGDTISLPAFDYYGTDSLFIVLEPGFDSIQLWNGEYRKRHLFGCITISGFALDVAEGIGDHRSAFPNLINWDPFHQSLITCFLLNGEYLFGPSPYPDECDFTVRITDIKQNDKIICKPNPADKFLSIILSYNGPEKYELQVINNIGNTFLQKSISTIKSEYVLDVSAFPIGIYFLILKNSQHYYTNKIIINH